MCPGFDYSLAFFNFNKTLWITLLIDPYLQWILKRLAIRRIAFSIDTTIQLHLLIIMWVTHPTLCALGGVIPARDT